MELQKLYSLTRKAIDAYHLIEEGDKIAIGIYGGKDSLTLLYALSGLRRFYPKHFELVAITVDLGYENFPLTGIKALCEKLNVPYSIVKTEIAKIVFDANKGENACSLCAKLRKGALNNEALRLGANKIAYAHHADDLLETMMLSLIYEGRFHSFSPKTTLDRTNLTVIRPMMYLWEADVIGFMHKMNLPVVSNPCPMDGITRRAYVKDLIRQINRENPGAKKRMLTAILNTPMDDWPELFVV